MKLSDLSIRRPVLASMLSLALVLFGIIGYRELSVREFPDVDPPIVSVTTVLPGANPQVVESAVTDVLEEELCTVEGLRTMTSSSGEEQSNITLEFTLDRDVEAAAQDVRDKVSRVRGRLPEDIEEPVVCQAGGRRPAVLLDGAWERELRPAPAVRYRRPDREAAAADHARRGPRRSSRRAAVLHAGLACQRPSSPRASSRCRTSRRRSGPATSRSRPAASSPTAGSSPCAPWASSRPRRVRATWSSRTTRVK